ncbi:MAG: hypothetical protein ACRC4L_01665 [Mycoplasma sp.]
MKISKYAKLIGAFGLLSLATAVTVPLIVSCSSSNDKQEPPKTNPNYKPSDWLRENLPLSEFERMQSNLSLNFIAQVGTIRSLGGNITKDEGYSIKVEGNNLIVNYGYVGELKSGSSFKPTWNKQNLIYNLKPDETNKNYLIKGIAEYKSHNSNTEKVKDFTSTGEFVDNDTLHKYLENSIVAHFVLDER